MYVNLAFLASQKAVWKTLSRFYILIPYPGGIIRAHRTGFYIILPHPFLLAVRFCGIAFFREIFISHTVTRL